MANNLGEIEGNFENLIINCDDEETEVNARSPKEIEDDIQSTPVTWNPFTVFPKEIYVKIFNLLKSPSDKQNFMNAHVKFYELFYDLRPELVNFLFGKAFGHLTLQEKDSDRNWIDLRLICRDWNQSIQDYYQLHPDHFDFEFCEDEWKKGRNFPLKGQYASGYIIESDYWEHSHHHKRALCRWSRKNLLLTNLERFVASQPPSMNPFFTRKVSIHVNCSGGVPKAFYTQLDNLFNTFGHNIYHFKITWTNCNESERFIIILPIMNWLTLMPELKTLKMEVHNRKDAKSVSDMPYQYFAPFFLPNGAPPEMKKLKNFHALNILPSIFNDLVSGMKALEKLEVGFDMHRPSENVKLQEYHLPTNLTELALTLTGADDFEYLKELEPSPILRKLIINMESMKLETLNSKPSQKSANSNDYRGIPCYFWPHWKTVWTTIEEKFPALEDLYLSLPRAEFMDKKTALEQSLDGRLNLRKLKRLSITSPNLASLDFLQEMKGLQELKIKLEHFEETFEGSFLTLRETVQFNRDLETMWESNIWQVFPKLRKLSIYAFGLEENCGVIVGHLYEKGKGDGKVYRKTTQKISQDSPFFT